MVGDMNLEALGITMLTLGFGRATIRIWEMSPRAAFFFGIATGVFIVLGIAGGM